MVRWDCSTAGPPYPFGFRAPVFQLYRPLFLAQSVVRVPVSSFHPVLYPEDLGRSLFLANLAKHSPSNQRLSGSALGEVWLGSLPLGTQSGLLFA